MSLSGRQRRQLRTIDRGLCRADPHLASILDIFARLAAEEAMPGREQLPVSPLARAALAAAAAAAAFLITCVRAARRRGLRCAAAACAAVARGSTGIAARRCCRHHASSRAAGTGTSGRPDQPGLRGR